LPALHCDFGCQLAGFNDIIMQNVSRTDQLDDKDAELLRLLASNARMPVATLAKRLGLARSTVQARLDRMEVTGVIAGYTLRLGEAARTRRIRATVLIEIEPRATAQVLARLKSVPEVDQVQTTTGRVDLIAGLAAPTTEALDGALDRIGGIPGVTDTESLIHLSTKIDRGL
jgi:DNA-binding Lrp family transcriptional regulator